LWLLPNRGGGKKVKIRGGGDAARASIGREKPLRIEHKKASKSRKERESWPDASTKTCSGNVFKLVTIRFKENRERGL